LFIGPGQEDGQGPVAPIQHWIFRQIFRSRFPPVCVIRMNKKSPVTIFGNPAISSLRPVAFRPYLAAGLVFSLI
jgi:hypothetical protein